MSRLFNMADAGDVSFLKKTQDIYARDVRAILADPDSHAALLVLKGKGWSSSQVHGAYSALLRKKDKEDT